MSERTSTTRARASTAVLLGDKGLRRLIGALTILAYLAVGAIVLYAISLIAGAVILLLFSILLGYFIYPLVRLLQSRLQPNLAILLAYLLVAGVLVIVTAIIVTSFIGQASALTGYIQFLLSPAGMHQLQSFSDYPGKFGISKSQVITFESTLLAQVQSVLYGVIPFLFVFFSSIINVILVITLSIYFVIDGARIVHWFRYKSPKSHRDTINFLLRVLDQSLGGYFRGSLLIALIGALGTSLGLALLHVNYAILLGVLFFFLYFIPVVGPIVIEVLCMLAAIPQGWIMVLIVAIYIMLLQGIVIGQILTPRIFSKAVGVHPIVALFALLAGAELFGLIGGFLSVPVAGVFQQIVIAYWHRWQDRHLKQFSRTKSY